MYLFFNQGKSEKVKKYGLNQMAPLSLLLIPLWILYLNLFSHSFIWDSHEVIKNNPLLNRDHPPTAAFKYSYLEPIGGEITQDYYRPLVVASFILEKKIWGLESYRLRVTNLIIFSLAVIFLYLFFKEQDMSPAFPLIAAAIFAYFPSNFDNIAWCVGRIDLFILMFGIMALFFLEKFIKKEKRLFLILSSLSVLAGIFSKESFVFFLPLLFLYEWFKRKKISWEYHITNSLFLGAFLLIKSSIVKSMTVGFNFFPTIMENVAACFGILGYYFRSLIFPFSYKVYQPVDNIITAQYIIPGCLALLLLILLLLKSMKQIQLRIPLSIILIFSVTYLSLGFSAIFPFPLSTRYLMLPLIGFAWIASKYICLLKNRLKYPAVCLIILAFIPTLFINADSYKSDLRYWENFYRHTPNNSFVLYSYGNERFKKNQFLEAEKLFRKALQYKLKIKTVIPLSMRLAELELKKTNYPEALLWIKRIENFPLSRANEFYINKLKTSIAVNKGDTQKAENILETMIQKFNRRETREELYNLYLGYNQWEKAAELETLIKKKYPGFKPIDIARLQKEFQTLSLSQKVNFYIFYHNYRAAAQILNTPGHLKPEESLQLANIYYLLGEPRKADALVEEIYLKNYQNVHILNRLGFFYIKELLDVEKSSRFFKASLEIDKNQSRIQKFYKNLRRLAPEN